MRILKNLTQYTIGLPVLVGVSAILAMFVVVDYLTGNDTRYMRQALCVIWRPL